MVPAVWRFLCFLLVAILVGQNVLLWLAANKSLGNVHGFPLSVQNPRTTWSFNASEDGNNFALTQAQCDAAFPDLYYEIDRAIAHRNDRKLPIKPEDVSISWRNDAAFRGLIHENQLRIIETKGAVSNDGYRRRTLSVISQINRAVLGATAAGQKLPSIEFAVTVDDMALLPNGDDTHAIWSFTRRIIDGDQHRLWMIPDMDYQAFFGASYAETRSRAAQRESFLVDKIPKAVWRGVVWTNEWVRKPLMEATKGKDWADVEEVSWEADAKDNMIPIEDYCRYAFIVHTEGRSWSGRLKHIMNCDSVPIVLFTCGSRLQGSGEAGEEVHGRRNTSEGAGHSRQCSGDFPRPLRHSRRRGMLLATPYPRLERGVVRARSFAGRFSQYLGISYC
jgi:hypothetical protein